MMANDVYKTEGLVWVVVAEQRGRKRPRDVSVWRSHKDARNYADLLARIDYTNVTLEANVLWGEGSGPGRPAVSEEEVGT